MAGDRGEVLNKGSDGTPVPMWAFEARFADLERLLTERDRRYMERMAGIEQHSLDRDLSHRREVQQLLTERDRFLAAAFASSEAAIGKADISTEKRFESVNEFRAQLKDSQATFITRAEYDPRHNVVVNELQELRLTLKDTLTKAEMATLNATAEVDRQALRREIQTLRETEVGGVSRRGAFAETRQNIQWVVGVAVFILVALASYLAAHVK